MWLNKMWKYIELLFTTDIFYSHLTKNLQDNETKRAKMLTRLWVLDYKNTSSLPQSIETTGISFTMLYGSGWILPDQGLNWIGWQGVCDPTWPKLEIHFNNGEETARFLFLQVFSCDFWSEKPIDGSPF